MQSAGSREGDDQNRRPIWACDWGNRHCRSAEIEAAEKADEGIAKSGKGAAESGDAHSRLCGSRRARAHVASIAPARRIYDYFLVRRKPASMRVAMSCSLSLGFVMAMTRS